MSFAVAIDGPAGSGKSTIAKIIAKEMNLLYLDTGAMYRACALKAVRLGISCTDEAAVDKMIEDISIMISFNDEGQQIFLDGENVTDFIRTPQISKGASDISAITSVRMRMVEIQRKIARDNDVIMDGRDIGTFVLPDALLKIFLTASIDERAGRRLKDYQAKGDTDITFDDIRKDMEIRDHNDSKRALAPLKKAEDAIEIDTTDLSIEKVVEKIIALINTKCLG
ncbi:MAG: (d)CMP kinase [Saccharofermentanales bacterium]